MISKNTSQVNEFSPALWQHISETLEREASSLTGPRIAAFDADGTLWDDDAGETFFQWQIDHAGLANLPADPWSHYHQMKTVDPISAYVWLAQISAGHSLDQVRRWAQQCFTDRPDWPVFQSQKRLITLLRSLDFEIFVVTASIKWAVEPVAARVGIDADHVLGITTQITDGIIGHQAILPITWREGKAEALLKASGGVRPMIAAGNTHGDISLLESATHVQLAVSTQIEPGGLHAEESRLATEASRRGWLQHPFKVKR